MFIDIILEMQGTSACIQSEQIEANKDYHFILPLRTKTLYPWTQSETAQPSLILGPIFFTNN